MVGNLDSKNYAPNPAAHPNSAQNLDSKPPCYVESSETYNIESKTDFLLNAQNDNKQNLDSINSMSQSSVSAQVAQNLDSKNHALNSQPQADLTRNLYSTQYTQTTNKNPSTKDTIHSTQNLTQANLIPLLHALKKPYITLDQLNSNHTKPHPLANIFHRKKSMRMYYTILPLNSLEASNIDIEKSDGKNFIIDDDNKTLICPFRTLDGLGDSVAAKIIEERNNKPFYSIEDFQLRGHVNGTTVDKLRSLGVFGNLPETSQLSLFDMI